MPEIRERVDELKSSPANVQPWWLQYLSLSTLLWLMLWFSINTGPGVLRSEPSGLTGHLHYLRTLFPFVVLLFAGYAMITKPRRGGKLLSGPVKLWLVYGAISLFACLMSPRPLDAAYWAIAYLCVFAAMKSFLQGKDVLGCTMHLNYLSWLITTVFLIVLLIAARDVLFIKSGWETTGYGVVVRMKEVGDMPMSRSSGMARFAAVPGVVSFVLLWRSGSWKRLFWTMLLISSGALIYLMQSRGAILGFGFALAFVMIFLGIRTRIIGVVMLLLFGLLLFTNVIPEENVENVLNHITRGQNMDELRELQGRTRTWEDGWEEIIKSPILGYGHLADRYLIGEHIHNTYLYALMTSGFYGAAAFAGGLIWAWVLFLRALKTGAADRLGQKVFLIQVGGILAFFSVRSIPEVCGAMFGVDLMVMLPILAYLGILDRQHKYWIKQQNRGKGYHSDQTSNQGYQKNALSIYRK